MQFCEGFLNQWHPYLLHVVTARKGRLACLCMHWETIVQDQVVPIVALADAHDVHAELGAVRQRHTVIEYFKQQICSTEPKSHKCVSAHSVDANSRQVIGVLILNLLKQSACISIRERTGAAARESLRRDRPSGLTLLALQQCQTFSRTLLSQQPQESSFITSCMRTHHHAWR